jgi:hypothetical protein
MVASSPREGMYPWALAIIFFATTCVAQNMVPLGDLSELILPVPPHGHKNPVVVGSGVEAWAYKIGNGKKEEVIEARLQMAMAQKLQDEALYASRY